MTQPACGIYRTTVAIAGIEANQLVYFHNHGQPGPGLYLPLRWHLNRAEFAERGQTLGSSDSASSLLALPAEGLYRVSAAFACCEKRCRTFAEETLLQLGYNGAGRAIVFEPEWQSHGLALPTTGQVIDDRCLPSLVRLQVRTAPSLAHPEHLH